jgi:hypothetical protein
VLLVQMFTFTEPALALQTVLGLLVLNAGFARLVIYRRRRVVRPAEAAPAAEPAMQP